MKTIVTKADYAALKKRTPSAISNWIADGKITKAALVGDGVRAKVWVEQADADLLRSLDPAQQSAQIAPVAASSPLPLEQGLSPGPLTSPRAAASSDDEDLRRRRKADADRAEHEAEAARRKLAVEEGRWVDAAEAAKVWGRELSTLLSKTETFLFTHLPRDLADRYPGLDWKQVAVVIRQLYRKHRAEVSDEAGARREKRQQELMVAE